MKLIDQINKINELFMSKKAGSFSNTPQRTVQAWTEKGLISPETGTTGSGDRRRYSVLNCIEIGIIKNLSDLRLSSEKTKHVMQYLTGHPPYDKHLLNLLLAEDEGFLVLQINTGKVITAPQMSICGFSEDDTLDLKHWHYVTCPTSADNTLILNINRIANTVVNKIKNGA